MQPPRQNDAGDIPAEAASRGPSAGQAGPEGLAARPRGFKWFGATILAVIALIAIAPQLVAWSPLRHETPRLRLRGFEGRIRVGHASLSWWSPIVLSDMELYSTDGEPFIHIRRYTEERSVFKLLFRRSEPSHIRVDEPRVSLLLRADGSNIEDALRPVLEHQQRSSTKERSLEVVDGKLKAVEAATGRSAEWTDITLRVHSSPEGSSPNEFELTTRLAGADEADPLAVRFSWFSDERYAKSAGKSRRSLEVKTANLPLASLDPLLARVVPDLEFAGTVTTDLHVLLPDQTATATGPVVQLDGRLSTRDLVITSPSRLGNDRFAVQSISLDGRLSSDGTIAHVERLDMKTDLGQLTAAGALPLAAFNDGDADATLADRLEHGDFALRGDVDLVRVASLLPGTLRLRDGMQLTDGRITLDVSSKVDNGRPRWKGELATTKLAATIGADRFSWEQPIRLSFDVRRELNRIEIDELTCESEVVRFSGHGNSDDASLTGRCGLNQFLTRLGQFVDMSERELRGQLTLASKWKRTPEGPIDLSVQANIEDFAAGENGGRLWSEPKLIARLDSRFTDHSLRPEKVHSLQVTLSGDSEQHEFAARLTEPVDLAANNPRWVWDVQMAGDLAHWQARLRPLGLDDNWKIAGSMQSASKISVSKDEFAIDSASLALKSLQLSARGYDLSEPEARLTAAGRWSQSQRRLTLSELALVGSAGSARGSDVVIAMADSRLPDLAGRLEFHSDLDRFNPADTPADQRPLAGTINVAVNFAQQDGQTTGKWQVDVENLSIRRKATKLVERRRGDVEQIESAPPAPAPRSAPNVPLDRKQRRAMEKAERESRRDARKHEREARKRAEEVVIVREAEWQTLWDDPHLTLSGKARFDPERDAVELTELAALTDGMRVTAGARIADATTRAAIDLQGEVDCDLERLLARLPSAVGRHVRITGREKRTFSLNGPIRGERLISEQQGAAVQHADAVASGTPTPRPAGTHVRPAAHETVASTAPLVSIGLTGAAQAGWQKANLFGLQAGPGEIDLRLVQGVVAMKPLDLALSGGKVHLRPQLLLNGSPAMLVMPAGPFVENLELTQDVCDTWLRFIAPILSEATRVEGRFSIDLAETKMPVHDPAAGDLSGRIHIATAQVLPGPLFAELAEVIGQIESAVRFGSSDLLGLDKPLVRIDNQQVNFKLQDRRLYSSPLAFNVRNIQVKTRGSVGVDQTLDMVAEITLPAEWVRKVKVLSRLEGKAMEVPIRGTLRHPQVDASGIGRFWEQFGVDTLDSLLNGGLQKLLDR